MKFWTFKSNLNPGEVVKVRSKEEIVNTLDRNNTLDGLPFMPEMLRYCGEKFRVVKLVRTIFVEGIGKRRINNAVILEGTMCSGEAHGDCQRQCVVLWKKSWLQRVHESDRSSLTSSHTTAPKRLLDRVFPCQSAELYKATSRHITSAEDFVQMYVCDARFRKWFPLKQMCTLLTWLIMKINMMGRRRKDTALYGRVEKTPVISLALKPGELVRVKNMEEIRATLDRAGKNRGLAFTPEMVKYCGVRARVYKKVNKIIDEATGKMQRIANTVILENVTCDGSSHADCPRNCYLLWREIWLKRV